MISGVSDLVSRQSTQTGNSDRADPRSLKKAASEFESLMITEMLKSMRGTDDAGWLGGGDDQAGSTMVEMAEQQLARALASSGGLGLSDLIVQGLAPAAHASQSPAGVANYADKKDG